MGPGLARESFAAVAMQMLPTPAKASQGAPALNPRQRQRAKTQLVCGAFGADQGSGSILHGLHACSRRASYEDGGRRVLLESNSHDRDPGNWRKRARLFTRCTSDQASGPSGAEASSPARADEASDESLETPSEEGEGSAGNGSSTRSRSEAGPGESSNGAFSSSSWDQEEEEKQRREGAAECAAELDQGGRLAFQTAEEIPVGVDGREPREPLPGSPTSGAPRPSDAKQGSAPASREGDAQQQNPGAASSAGKGAEFTEGSGDRKPQTAAGPLRRFRRLLRAILSVMPYGSWWQVGLHREGPQGRRMARSLQQLWGLAKADTGLLALATLFLALAALSEVAIPHYLAATIFSASNAAKDRFHYNSRLLIIMTVACGVFSGLRAACFGILNLHMVKRMRSTLFETLISQDVAFFDRESVGDLTSRLGSDAQSVSHIISIDLNIILRNTLQGLGAFVFLVRLSWKMTLVTMALCALMWYCLLIYGRFQREIAKVLQDTVASANEVAEEALSLARVVRTFGTEQQEVERYKRPLRRLVEIGKRRTAAYSLWASGGLTIYNAAQVAAVIGGGSAVMAKVITSEQLTKFILYAEWLVHATWWVGDHWASFMEALGSCERVFELLDMPKASQLTKSEGRQLPFLQGRIEFQGVSFAYPTRPTMPVLDDVSLVIEPGELVALVGLSGSGKSTLVGLLLRLYEPTQGQVLLDGVPLEDLDVGWYRKQLGVVSQEPRLFSTDIASNIAYGNQDGQITEERVRRAAQQAYADEFVGSLPEGYSTVVDNARLSGGQKQRIAIARALVRDPRILILDEATSALDAESEFNVQRALDEAMSNGSAGRRTRTVLVIAHRLSTVRNADRIVVMSAGRIVEFGTHSQLMAMGGEYAKLNARQVDALA